MGEEGKEEEKTKNNILTLTLKITIGKQLWNPISLLKAFLLK